MNALEYAAIAAYAVVLVRCLSFGVYGLKHDNGALFAVTLFLAAASAALFAAYLATTA